MKAARGFATKLTKEDDKVVEALMKAHPLWPKTYARRIAALKKFHAKMRMKGNNNG